jgi:hypothetical protein
MVDKMRKEGKTFFLDSGAFSAYTQNVTIDIQKYCQYIERNKDIFHCASVLDAIGDYKGTYRNQIAMQNMLPKELWPLPCYHYGEPHEVLEYYIANYEYITIGGMVPIPNATLGPWLDEIWSKFLTNLDGTPKLRVHGFGLTSLPLMFRYPWYSVDSSSWVQFAANGMILMPGIGRAVNVSSQSGQRRNAGQHLDTLPEPQTKAVEAEMMREGFDPERLRTQYIARWAWNAWAIPEYAKRRGSGIDKLDLSTYVGLF